MKENIKTSYLYNVFNKDNYICLMDKLYNKVEDIKKRKGFDSIAFTGVSGAAVAFPLSLELNTHLICIRKGASGKYHHSSYNVEGNASCRKYIIVDDMIDSGNTFKNIIDKTSKFTPKAICVGIVLYYDCGNFRYRTYKGSKIPVYRVNL